MLASLLQAMLLLTIGAALNWQLFGIIMVKRLTTLALRGGAYLHRQSGRAFSKPVVTARPAQLPPTFGHGTAAARRATKSDLRAAALLCSSCRLPGAASALARSATSARPATTGVVR